MASDDTPSLPAEIEELIQSLYAPEEQSKVRAALLEYGASGLKARAELERIWFDVLHLGRGDSTRVRTLIDQAKLDLHDVMAQEYFPRAGKFYPHAWARRHTVNRDIPEPPPLNTGLLATAEVGFHPPSRDVREGTRKPFAQRTPRVLLLTFSEASKVATAAEKIALLSSHGGVLDLTPLIEYLPLRFLTPQQTLLHCLRDDDAATLKYADNVLSWSGGCTYWNECSRKLARLEKNNESSQISLMDGTTSDQAVIARLRKVSVTL